MRLTGGEPLLRHDLARLVRLLAGRSAIEDLALTTNGILLAEQLDGLVDAGLRRATISLDTLVPERLKRFARSDRHGAVLEGIEAAVKSPLESVKLNSVVIRGYNDDEIHALLSFASERDLELRYIEYMDVGGATGWQSDAVVSRAEILQRVAARFGPVEPVDGRGVAPAERFRLRDGTTFGIIASTTAPFCGSCDRSRVTADGTWYLCLYADRGIDVREALRGGMSDEGLAELVVRHWGDRADRGAEARAAMPERGALYPIEGLRADPRREMHTRGG